MTPEEITSLVVEVQRFGTEQPGIEVKTALQGTPRDSLRKSMSALSNRSGGGLMLFGIDERRAFAVTGVGNPSQLQEDISSAGAELTPPASRSFYCRNRRRNRRGSRNPRNWAV